MDIHVRVLIGNPFLVSWTSLVIPWRCPTTAWNSLIGQTNCISFFLNYMNKWKCEIILTYKCLCLCLVCEFSSRYDEQNTCPLVVMNNSYSCVCKVKDYSLSFHDTYKIKLCQESECDVLTESFQPSQNSKHKLFVVHSNCLHWYMCVFACLEADMSAWYCSDKMTVIKKKNIKLYYITYDVCKVQYS